MNKFTTEHQIPRKLPSDAIIVSEIEMPKKNSVTNAIKSILPRFYDQKFTWRHVYACVLRQPGMSNRTDLHKTVRSIIHKMYYKGQLERVEAGSKRGAKLSVYRNLKDCRNG